MLQSAGEQAAGERVGEHVTAERALRPPHVPRAPAGTDLYVRGGVPGGGSRHPARRCPMPARRLPSPTSIRGHATAFLSRATGRPVPLGAWKKIRWRAFRMYSAARSGGALGPSVLESTLPSALPASGSDTALRAVQVVPPCPSPMRRRARRVPSRIRFPASWGGSVDIQKQRAEGGRGTDRGRRDRAASLQQPGRALRRRSAIQGPTLPARLAAAAGKTRKD